jgi:hypothetical protein
MPGPHVDFEIGVPDPNYRLPEEDRAKVGANFDADALERLLSMVPPDTRDDILPSFVPPDPSVGERPSGWLVRLGHPALQAALEEVWVPYWRHVSDEDLDSGSEDHIPGRELAKQRRRRGP